MKKIALLIVCLFLSNGVYANEDTKQASIQELFTVMKADSLLNAYYSQLNNLMDSMDEKLELANSPEKQKIKEKYNQKMIELMQKEMGWNQMKDKLATIYSTHYSEEEINDLLAFYKTKSGQSFLDKMPEVNKEAMQVGQSIAQDNLPKIIALLEEMIKETKALDAPKESPKPEPSKNKTKSTKK